MAITIKRTGFDQFHDPQGGAWIKALIMGDHGVGKTPSAAQWPKPIIADCERGLMSVAQLAVPYAEVAGTKDMEELIQHLKMDSRKSPTNRSYQTLIIDTIDTYQRKMIAERLAAERKESISGWADWGWLDAKMQQLMEALVSLNMNVVVNMHTKDITEGDDDDRQIISKARLKGDIKDSIFQEFDLIGHMEQAYEAGTGERKGERVRVRQIRWHSEPRFPALRDRSNRLPRFTPVTFTDQDYWGLFNKITEGVDDLPETKVLEEVGEAVAEPVTDAPGGPVSGGALPPAKKAAAKKAPAAKKAAAVPASEPVNTPASDAAAEVAAEKQVAAEDAAVKASEQATEAPKAEDEIVLFDRLVVTDCTLPHKFEAVEVGTRNGDPLTNQICVKCNVREVELTAQEKAAHKAAVESGGQDPWAPPAETPATAVVVEGDADADAAEQLLAEALGAEEVAEPVEDIAGQQTNGKGTADEPVFLPNDLPMAQEARVLESLDHAHLPDGTCRKNTFGPKCGEAPAATPAPAAPAAAAKPGAPICGDQPASMVGKKEAVPGCGTTLDSQTNAKKAQIAMLRMGTFLCDSCHEAARAAA